MSPLPLWARSCSASSELASSEQDRQQQFCEPGGGFRRRAFHVEPATASIGVIRPGGAEGSPVVIIAMPVMRIAVDPVRPIIAIRPMAVIGAVAVIDRARHVVAVIGISGISVIGGAIVVGPAIIAVAAAGDRTADDGAREETGAGAPSPASAPIYLGQAVLGRAAGCGDCFHGCDMG